MLLAHMKLVDDQLAKLEAAIGSGGDESGGIECQGGEAMRIGELCGSPALPFANAIAHAPAGQCVGGNERGLTEPAYAIEDRPRRKLRQADKDLDTHGAAASRVARKAA